MTDLYPDRVTTAKKTPAKKTPAKKTTAKKTTAKKAPAKKTTAATKEDPDMPTMGTVQSYDPSTGQGTISLAAEDAPDVVDFDLASVDLKNDGYVEFFPGRDVKLKYQPDLRVSRMKAL